MGSVHSSLPALLLKFNRSFLPSFLPPLSPAARNIDAEPGVWVPEPRARSRGSNRPPDSGLFGSPVRGSNPTTPEPNRRSLNTSLNTSMQVSCACDLHTCIASSALSRLTTPCRTHPSDSCADAVRATVVTSPHVCAVVWSSPQQRFHPSVASKCTASSERNQ